MMRFLGDGGGVVGDLQDDSRIAGGALLADAGGDAGCDGREGSH